MSPTDSASLEDHVSHTNADTDLHGFAQHSHAKMKLPFWLRNVK